MWLSFFHNRDALTNVEVKGNYNLTHNTHHDKKHCTRDRKSFI